MGGVKQTPEFRAVEPVESLGNAALRGRSPWPFGLGGPGLPGPAEAGGSSPKPPDEVVQGTWMADALL